MSAIEVSASDVESAITQGLQQLDLIRAEVKIEVLDEGSRGVLGIGARPARVRLTPFSELAEAESQAQPQAQPQAQSQADVHQTHTHPSPGEPSDAAPTLPPDVAAVAHEGTQVTTIVVQDDAQQQDQQDNDRGVEDEAAPKIEGEDLALELTRGILERMGLKRTQVTSRSVFPADSDDEPSIWIDIHLDRDEDLLLGHQHEGLTALQTIIQTMWSHQTKSSLRVNVDVNGYRQRREQQLINMAKRLAEKVIANGKPITLEPMPANERRIVHMALRDQPGVFTESFGEGVSRKVQIKPKK